MYIKASILRSIAAVYCAVYAVHAAAPFAMADSIDDEYAAYAEQSESNVIPDPFESFNRTVFTFNDKVDQAITEPLAKGYRYVVPLQLRGMAGNILRNLRQPSSALNHLLQGDPENAGHALWSFLIDSAAGAGALGITEAAGTMPHEEDFNQTLAVWGVPSGPYIVLPFMGPSTVRGVVGYVADRAAVPDYILLHGEDAALAASNVFNVIHTRYELLPVTDAIKENTAFDLYSSFKSAYTQNMNKRISE